MKRLKPQMNPNCRWCKALGLRVPAVYISDSRDLRESACESHKGDLQELDDKRRRLDAHHSEADYQTWMKL